MSASLAESTARKIMAAEGRQKVVAIYGGEPMIHFGVMSRLMATARECASKSGQGLSLSVATNGLLLKASHFRFFREQSVHLCISVGGADHDQSRRDVHDGPTRAATLKAMDVAIQEMPVQSITALLCVGPGNAGTWDEEAQELAERGYENFNLEIIQGVNWTSAKRREFSRAFRRHAQWLGARLMGKHPIYLQSLNQKLAESLRIASTEVIEILPDGRTSLLPYPFAHRPELRRTDHGAEVLASRDILSGRLARRFLHLAARRPLYRDYIRDAVLRSLRD